MIKYFRLFILTFLLASLVPVSLRAEDPAAKTAPAPAAAKPVEKKPAPPPADISVKAEVNRAAITIGDPVEYTVTIKRDPSVQVLSPIPAPDASILKIRKVQDINSKEGKRIIEGRSYTLTTFKLGDFVLDPVSIQYRSGGGDPQTLTTDPIYISVKSVAAGDPKNDIRGLKMVLNLPKAVVAALSIGFLIALLILALIIYRRLRKKSGAEDNPKSVLTPEDEAFFNLNQLFDSDLLRRSKIKEYYLRLSEILRIYFERRYGILAVEYTTDEILKALKDKEIARELRVKIQEVLEAADLAKFAKWKPEPAEIVKINQKSKQIVDEAKPGAQPASSPEAPRGI